MTAFLAWVLQLSEYRWWRKRQGGHWEHWVQGPRFEGWLRVDACSHVTGIKPMAVHRWVACEDWPV